MATIWNVNTMLNIALALFFFMVSYILFDTYINQADNSVGMEEEGEPFNGDDTIVTDSLVNEVDTVRSKLADQKPGEGDTAKEVIYTQDYYPWWRSTRWWNYDGWLYQKPYYNYWRRQK